ncbi:hypothetical protein SDC9_95522 [bioreactor metagenome]|uniref:Uncharacterized protein n=1 Tax=bioreactor metagenome TaxID=1076179 RepID=A0A645A6J2_9ZZZZ
MDGQGPEIVRPCLVILPEAVPRVGEKPEGGRRLGGVGARRFLRLAEGLQAFGDGLGEHAGPVEGEGVFVERFPTPFFRPPGQAEDLEKEKQGKHGNSLSHDGPPFGSLAPAKKGGPIRGRPKCLSDGAPEEGEQVFSEDSPDVLFAPAPGEQFGGKGHASGVALHAVVFPEGAGTGKVPGLVAEIETEADGPRSCQPGNAVGMVRQVFPVHGLFVRVCDKGAAGVHPLDASPLCEARRLAVGEVAHHRGEGAAVGVGRHDGAVEEFEDVFHPFVVEMADVEVHPEAEGLPEGPDAEFREPPLPPLLRRVEEAPVGGVVPPAPCDAHTPDAELEKDPEEGEVVPYGVQPFKREEKGKLSPSVGLQDLAGAPAEGEEPRAFLHFGVEGADVVERPAEAHLGEVPAAQE